MTKTSSGILCKSAFYRLWDYEVCMYDVHMSRIEPAIIGEYNGDKVRSFLNKIRVKAGDVIIDIGAHIGTFSVLFGMRFPKARILAYEPIPENYDCLCANLKENGVENVTPFNLAVTSDERDLDMAVSFEHNSGGASGFMKASGREFQSRDLHKYVVKGTTLESIFKDNAINKAKLVKIDTEGAEHEILMNAPTTLLKSIEYMTGELHINSMLERKGYGFGPLGDRLEKHINPNKMQFVCIRMSE